MASTVSSRPRCAPPALTAACWCPCPISRSHSDCPAHAATVHPPGPGASAWATQPSSRTRSSVASRSGTSDHLRELLAPSDPPHRMRTANIRDPRKPGATVPRRHASVSSHPVLHRDTPVTRRPSTTRENIASPSQTPPTTTSSAPPSSPAWTPTPRPCRWDTRPSWSKAAPPCPAPSWHRRQRRHTETCLAVVGQSGGGPCSVLVGLPWQQASRQSGSPQLGQRIALPPPYRR
jgi:hypothetical protein